MIGGLVDAILGKSNARVKAFKPDTRAGTAAIKQQAQQATAGAYGLAASQRGGMGAAAGIRGAQQAGVQANQNALQQQRQLEQSAAAQHAQNRQQAEMANVQIAQNNANNLQKVAGLAVGAGMMLSDERAKELVDENTALKQQLKSLMPLQPPRFERQIVQQPEYENAAQERVAAAQYYKANTEALERQRAQELAEVRARSEAQRRQEQDLAAATRAADFYRDANVRSSDMRTTSFGAPEGQPLQPIYHPQQTSDYRTKQTSDERGKGMLGMHGGMDFPNGVKPVEYEYKDEAMGLPGTEPGQQFGVLAQDLEKSKEGRTVVEEDPETGMKMVDTPQLTMLLAAKTSEFEERLKRLEGSGRGRKA